MDKIGIKESLELLNGVEILAVASIEISKDGFGADDIAKALELVKKSDAIIEAFKGIDQLDDEIKDLDQAELIQLGVASFSLVKKIAASIKSKEV